MKLRWVVRLIEDIGKGETYEKLILQQYVDIGIDGRTGYKVYKWEDVPTEEEANHGR